MQTPSSLTDDLNAYLASTPVVDFTDPDVAALAARFAGLEEEELVAGAFRYVLEEVGHSVDVKGSKVACAAPAVLKTGHGLCYAKSHLLAAILRANGIPTGFCYQVLVFDDADPLYKTLHGLNAVYLKGRGQWVRIDPRGNKPGIDARFAPPEEFLAFPTREEMGEALVPVIFSEPDPAIVEALATDEPMDVLIHKLPENLAGGTVEIGPAVPEEAAAILEVQRTAFSETALASGSREMPSLKEGLDAVEAAVRNETVLAARCGGAVVGSVRGRMEGTTCHIGMLSVLPGFRKRGLGKRLTLAVEQAFPEAERFHLFTGERSLGNIALYRSLGYEETGKEPVVPGFAFVHMEKASEGMG